MGNAAVSSDVPTLLVDPQTCGLLDRLKQEGKSSIWKITRARVPFFCSLFLTNSGPNYLRWDPNVMTPANAVAESVREILHEELERGSVTTEIFQSWAEPGEALVIDNWRLLHARPHVPEPGAGRTLYRVFVSES